VKEGEKSENVTSMVLAFEYPPPGPGLNTVMVGVFALAISEAGIAAVSFEPVTKVVVREEPFQLTVDPATNPVPVTVKVNAGPPGAMAAGTIGSNDGTGFWAADTADGPRVNNRAAAVKADFQFVRQIIRCMKKLLPGTGQIF
jgi:hypothetical protein